MAHADFSASHRYREVSFDHAAATAGPSVIAALQAQAARQPKAVYLTAVGRDGAETRLTYEDLDVASKRLATWVRVQLRLEKGVRVALLPGNDAESVIAIFALLRVGCEVWFINPAERPARLADLLSGADVAHVLCARANVAGQLPGITLLPQPAELADLSTVAFAEEMLTGTDVALLFGTSGSTATSKIVAQAHLNTVVNAEALRRHHGLGPGVRMLGCLPVHHVNGLHFTILATMCAGAEAILLEAFNPLTYFDALGKYRPQLASVVPSLLDVLLCARSEFEFPPEFRYFVSAAAPLSVNTCRAVYSAWGVRVNQGYGLTETTNFSTTMPPGVTDATYRRMMLDTEIPSIGVALYGNEVAVLGTNGTLLKPGEVGEICMRGHNVMLGYDSNDEATGEAFKDGWFHSQDLGYAVYDEESGLTFFVITGRQKNMAKVMGVAVSLEEMERALRKLPGVIDVACFTRPDKLLGESIVAAVVSSEPLQNVLLHQHLGGYFSTACLPTKYVRVDAIPRTATGKILRAQLPAAFC